MNHGVKQSQIKLETQINVNNELDCSYGNLVNVIVNEMDKYINFKCIPKQLKKKNVKFKTYWAKKLNSHGRQWLIIKKNIEISEGTEIVKLTELQVS